MGWLLPAWWLGAVGGGEGEAADPALDGLPSSPKYRLPCMTGRVALFLLFSSNDTVEVLHLRTLSKFEAPSSSAGDVCTH